MRRVRRARPARRSPALLGALALLLGGEALATVPLDLPASEDSASWSHAAELGGLKVGAAGACPWVKMAPTATGWRIEVCDAEGQTRDATIGRPASLPEREAAVLLAQSLLRPAGMALPGMRATVPPPPAEPEPVVVAAVSPRVQRPVVVVEPVVEEIKPPPPPEPSATEVAEQEGVVDLTERRRRKRDPVELDMDTDDDAPPGPALEDRALDGGELQGWSAWWTVLGLGRVWEGTEPDLGARLRLGMGLPSGWLVGLDAQTGPSRALLLDETTELHQQTFTLGVWTPGLGPTGSYLSSRVGIGFVRPSYDGVELRRASSPVFELAGGLPFARAAEWAVVAELGGSVHLRGLELHWADGRNEVLTLWQAELALGLRVGRLR